MENGSQRRSGYTYRGGYTYRASCNVLSNSERSVGSYFPYDILREKRISKDFRPEW
jgi:hypothetical protein